MPEESGGSSVVGSVGALRTNTHPRCRSCGDPERGSAPWHGASGQQQRRCETDPEGLLEACFNEEARNNQAASLRGN